MQSHAKRWITALIAVPLLFWIIGYAGKTAFALLIAVASVIGTGEYNRMVFVQEARSEKTIALAASFLFPMTALSGSRELLLALAAFSVLTVFVFNLLRAKKGMLAVNFPARTVLGIMYIPLLLSHLILLRALPSGHIWIFYLLVVAFAGDVAAYYVGRSLGKSKLLAEVSPGKTIAGTVGLMVGSTLGSVVFFLFFFPHLPILHAFLMGLVGGIIGQLGDLTESALKREAGVKDSGTLLPGHGGILDRLDCLLFIAPFIFYYREFIIR